MARGKRHSNQHTTTAHKNACPERIPANTPIDPFTVGEFPCPEQIPTPRFSSPNSGLPPAELAELKDCIEEANHILQTAGNPFDPQNRSSLRLRFRSLKGRKIEIEIDCDREKLRRKGIITEVGKDNLVLQRGDKVFIVLFARICSIIQVEKAVDFHNSHHHSDLADLSPELRRDLVLRFGEVVSQSPKLLNIFFGAPFHAQLVPYFGCRVQVKLENEIIQGWLVSTEEGQITVQNNHYQLENVNNDQICVLEIFPEEKS